MRQGLSLVDLKWSSCRVSQSLLGRLGLGNLDLGPDGEFRLGRPM